LCPDGSKPSDYDCNSANNEDQIKCEETGGEWILEADNNSICVCEFGKAFSSELGGCINPQDYEQVCIDSGGTFTDEASDAFYCLCPDGSKPSDYNCAS
jgi:hypothetical protein